MRKFDDHVTDTFTTTFNSYIVNYSKNFIPDMLFIKEKEKTEQGDTTI